MVEVIIFLSIILFCLLGDKYKVLNIFIFIIPFHLFIKSLLTYFYGGGGIFASWKELVILIFAYKVFKTDSIAPINKNLRLLFGFFIVLILIYYLLAKSYGDALPQLRDHIFPIILFFSVYSISWQEKKFKPTVTAFILGAFLSTIGGFVQHYFLNVPISTIKGTIDFIDASGYIQYTTTSPRIMGMERMSGLLSGPNDFGVYLALMLSFCIFFLYSKASISQLSRRRLLFIRVATISILICLLLSFSRAGWAIAVFSIGLLVIRRRIKINKKVIFNSVLFIFLLVVFIIANFPSAFDIITNSLSGKEESAAARSESFTTGIEKNYSEPFGHGLGTADNRSALHEFFVESAFLNISYEISVIGLLTLLLIHIFIVRTLRRRYKVSFFASLAAALSSASIIASFVSINTYGMPYIYLWWLMLGLGLNGSFALDTGSSEEEEPVEKYSLLNE